jgi:hypothetical protein
MHARNVCVAAAVVQNGSLYHSSPTCARNHVQTLSEAMGKRAGNAERARRQALGREDIPASRLVQTSRSTQKSEEGNRESTTGPQKEELW